MRNVTFLLWVLLTAGAAVAAPADYCSKPIRVAMFELGVLYKSGDGLDVRFLDAIAKRSGCTFDLVLMPRARIWAEMKSGTLDMATAAIATPERREFGYLLPYMSSRNVLLVRKGGRRIPSSMADLQDSDLRMARVRGFRHEPAYDVMLDYLATQGRVIDVADTVDLHRFLERGMVDAIVSTPTVFREYLSSSVIDNALVVRDWAPKEQMIVGHLILGRNAFTPEQARRMDRLVAAMLADGTFFKIANAFLSTREARDLVYKGPRNPE